jgi:rhodanese-related sulfurtransferase
MDRSNPIRENGSDHGTSFSGVSNRLQKAIRVEKKYLAVGLLVLLAGWMSLMAFMGKFELGLPVTSGAPQETVKFTLLDAQELKDWLDQGSAVVLIDARSTAEFAAGHIPAAVNKPMGHSAGMGSQNQELDVRIVFYCAGSSESGYSPCARAIEQALRSGSQRVYWFKGGMTAWRAQGYPVERSS